MIKLMACPFCGGEAEMHEVDERSVFKDSKRFHLVRCRDCDAQGSKHEQISLRDMTSYTVADFRQNPVLQAKVEDEYEANVASTKDRAAASWNRRVSPYIKPRGDCLL